MIFIYDYYINLLIILYIYKEIFIYIFSILYIYIYTHTLFLFVHKYICIIEKNKFMRNVALHFFHFVERIHFTYISFILSNFSISRFILS